MSISQEQFEQAMQTVNPQIQTLDRALNARIALAEAEVLRLRSLRDSGTQQAKSGIMDARKIYPADLEDMVVGAHGRSACFAGHGCNPSTSTRLFGRH